MNYAVICLAGYLLGIADRHLENFLVNCRTGEIILIDFGYSFGAGFNIPVPELMPFRLTKVIENLFNPVGTCGIFRHSMIAALNALRKRRHILLDFCYVFITDPLMDWLKP